MSCQAWASLGEVSLGPGMRPQAHTERAACRGGGRGRYRILTRTGQGLGGKRGTRLRQGKRGLEAEWPCLFPQDPVSLSWGENLACSGSTCGAFGPFSSLGTLSPALTLAAHCSHTRTHTWACPLMWRQRPLQAPRYPPQRPGGLQNTLQGIASHVPPSEAVQGSGRRVDCCCLFCWFCKGRGDGGRIGGLGRWMGRQALLGRCTWGALTDLRSWPSSLSVAVLVSSLSCQIGLCAESQA